MSVWKMKFILLLFFLFHTHAINRNNPTFQTRKRSNSLRELLNDWKTDVLLKSLKRDIILGARKGLLEKDECCNSHYDGTYKRKSNEDCQCRNDVTTTYSQFYSSCGRDFDCRNRKCVDQTLRCDSDDDCGNWQDENYGCRTKYSEKEIRSTTKLKYGYYGPVLVRGRPVCDDFWENIYNGKKNSKVVCRSMGYPSNSIAEGWLGDTVDGNKKVGGFLMDNVRCKGDESSLKQCPHITWHNCGNTEGAGVICLRDNEFTLKGSINRVGSLYFREIPVCNTITAATAHVICNQLYGEDMVSLSTTSPSSTTYIHLTLQCNGGEKSVSQCTTGVSTSTCSSVAYIRCN